VREELSEIRNVPIDLSALERSKVGHPLVTVDGDSWVSSAQQHIVHQQSRDPSVAIEERVDRHELEVREHRLGRCAAAISREELSESLDEVGHLLRVGRYVSPAARKPNGARAPAPKVLRLDEPSIYRGGNAP
jgi:hypothetical protein